MSDRIERRLFQACMIMFAVDVALLFYALVEISVPHLIAAWF